MKPETERWVEMGEGHMDLAEAGVERRRYGLCVFHCQQAIEMMLKALIVESGEVPEPPKIHNLMVLARRARIELTHEQKQFLGRLTRHIPTRYGGMALEYARQDAENYYAGAKELFAWLRQRLS